MQRMFQLVLLMAIILCHTKSDRKNNTDNVGIYRNCECVHFMRCKDGSEIIDGTGFLDIRMNKRTTSRCKDILEVCCKRPDMRTRSNSGSDYVPLQVGIRGCGIRNFDGIEERIMSQGINKAKFGEFPWMVAVLLRTPEQLDHYRCGGALIHRKVVLTAAHCVSDKTASMIKIRAGEWDAESIDESVPHQDRAVEAIVIHENHGTKNLHNDFALLILLTPVNIAESVDIVCLPEDANEYDARRCVATGWGRNGLDNGSHYQSILRTVELPIVPKLICQNRYRRTRLGKNFELDDSFICAGGKESEDACKGDGGSPLVCPLKNDSNRYVQVGIVSWGIGCGTGLPSVFANVLSAREWIDEQMLFHQLDNGIYRHTIDNSMAFNQ